MTGIIIMLAAYASVFTGAEYLLRRGWSPLMTRKFAHAAGGLVSCALPLFVSKAVAIAIGAGASLLLSATAQTKMLRSIHDGGPGSAGAALFPAGLDSLYVSVDFSDPRKHDRQRGVEGLFNRAVEGLDRAIAAGFSTGISCCISPESFRDGELDRIIELARDIGAHEVIVYDTAPTGRYAARDDLLGDNGWTEEMIASVGRYNENPAYPGILVYAYTTSHRSLGCSCGVNYLYLSPYGDVCPCDFNHVIFGNALKKPLYEIWDAMTSLPDFRCAKWGYCRMKDPKFKDSKTISREFKNYG